MDQIYIGYEVQGLCYNCTKKEWEFDFNAGFREKEEAERYVERLKKNTMYQSYIFRVVEREAKFQ